MKYYVVGRPIDGVTINGIEWLLDEENNLEIFSLDEALEALHMPSLEWAENAGYIFDEVELTELGLYEGLDYE